MADYDVGITGLSSPPSPAYVSSYRPAVSVRNSGIHDAFAAGTFRIYTAGKLVFSTQILSGSIAPKQSKDALGLDYWTPPAPGTYMVIAHVDTYRDQNLSNNDLAPVTISVIAGTPPPPPAVTAHAAQHEEGAADEIDLDGMRGVLADKQTPRDHASDHELDGDDEISVAGLKGILADPQPIANHGNEAHTSDFVDQDAVDESIGTHNGTTAPHPGATNLEYVENKGAAGGYAPLGDDGLVPPENLPPSQPGAHAETHETGGDDELSVAGLHGQLGDYQPVAAHAGSHEVGQFDEMSVNGLWGVLADAQTPVSHTANEHDTSVEETASKGQPSGYCDLDANGKVPVERIDIASVPNHGATHGHEGGDDISIGGLSGMPAAAGSALGLATLGADGILVPLQRPPTQSHANEAHSSAMQLASDKSQANGYAPLDGDGLVPNAHLPNFANIWEVLDYENEPVVGTWNADICLLLDSGLWSYVRNHHAGAPVVLIEATLLVHAVQPTTLTFSLRDIPGQSFAVSLLPGDHILVVNYRASVVDGDDPGDTVYTTFKATPFPTVTNFYIYASGPDLDTAFNGHVGIAIARNVPDATLTLHHGQALICYNE